MNILYLSQYYPPEIGATQTRAFEMTRGLIKAGHRVIVITEFPNHPTGIIPDAYRGRIYQRETVEGVEVIRLWVKASPSKTFGRRIVFYLSFMVMAALAGLFLTRGRIDALYVTSPPLFVGGASLLISYLRRIPLFFEVRDLWPESAVQMDILHNERAIQISTWLEEACYRRARKIVCVTRGIQERLLERGIPGEKLVLIPNGANVELYRPLQPSSDLRQVLGLEDGHFVIIYVGLFGLIHGLETVLEAAELVAGDADIRFLFVGDGPRKRALKEMASEKKLNNVIFHDAVPEQELPGFIALADVGLHVQRRLEISKMALPVKMFSYMACEKPVILAVEGEAAELVLDNAAGVVVEPESAPDLAEAILRLAGDEALRREYGCNGRKLVEQHFARHVLAARLADVLADNVHENHRV